MSPRFWGAPPPHLPLLDVVPQVLELLKAKFPRCVALGGMSRRFAGAMGKPPLPEPQKYPPSSHPKRIRPLQPPCCGRCRGQSHPSSDQDLGWGGSGQMIFGGVPQPLWGGRIGGTPGSGGESVPGGVPVPVGPAAAWSDCGTHLLPQNFNQNWNILEVFPWPCGDSLVGATGLCSPLTSPGDLWAVGPRTPQTCCPPHCVAPAPPRFWVDTYGG